jgi:general transcription factor 3C polypeptide 5 (transcription factor C subunit 1)
MGDVIDTSNLLLKVTRRRRKRPSGPNGTWLERDETLTTAVVGIVTKTCRFRSMADFQYIVDRDDSMFKIRKSLGEYDGERHGL